MNDFFHFHYVRATGHFHFFNFRMMYVPLLLYYGTTVLQTRSSSRFLLPPLKNIGSEKAKFCPCGDPYYLPLHPSLSLVLSPCLHYYYYGGKVSHHHVRKLPSSLVIFFHLPPLPPQLSSHLPIFHPIFGVLIPLRLGLFASTLASQLSRFYSFSNSPPFLADLTGLLWTSQLGKSRRSQSH